MDKRNNQTNMLIKHAVIALDFVILNLILLLLRQQYPVMDSWDDNKTTVFWMICNMGMALSQVKFRTIIHRRVISGGDILRRVFFLVTTQVLVTYLLTRAIIKPPYMGELLIQLGIFELFILIVMRLIERSAVKTFRQRGWNNRTVTFVGADMELKNLYQKLSSNPMFGYTIRGYYADEEMEEMAPINRLGTLQSLMEIVEENEEQDLGDEIYACLPRHDYSKLLSLSNYCDQHIIHFYYVPTLAERFDMKLKREFFDEIELFTTHQLPLADPMNRIFKRLFDIVFSLFVLLIVGILYPIIAIIIKRQSPGPVFFKQQRTGISGGFFDCYKFRSMHVNATADKQQATRDDPRKFPFGSFMRKYDIDELPQFWNVLKGDMSIVGPRPHMLYHTEQYSKLIAKYMVRHFVKPGITGWAQVTGFRGETRELWQMEERVRRDIWYVENWSIWLDLRILSLTVRRLFDEENAY